MKPFCRHVALLQAVHFPFIHGVTASAKGRTRPFGELFSFCVPQTFYWKVGTRLSAALHPIHSLLCLATNQTPQMRLYSFSGRAMFGVAACYAFLLLNNEVVLWRRFVRNTDEPGCDAVELLSGNPTYSTPGWNIAAAEKVLFLLQILPLARKWSSDVQSVRTRLKLPLLRTSNQRWCFELWQFWWNCSLHAWTSSRAIDPHISTIAEIRWMRKLIRRYSMLLFFVARRVSFACGLCWHFTLQRYISRALESWSQFFVLFLNR